jgi:uracil-DNA glycosylase family 4
MTSAAGRRAMFLNELGVSALWLRRDPLPAVSGAAAQIDLEAEPSAGLSAASLPDRPEAGHATTLAATAPSASEIAQMDWPTLKAAVAGCTKCNLCNGRTNTVFGVGDEKAKWLFIGEGPGRSEDLQGKPFVGPAGKLLDNMLLAMDLKRGDNAYITNIVKCRPTGPDGRDRPPTPAEAAACMPYLQRQIALIRPGVIAALGKTAALSLLGLDQDTSVAQLRGKVHRYTGSGIPADTDLPLIVTYHPAYLLRKPADKGKTWGDLCLAMNTYVGNNQQQ